MIDESFNKSTFTKKYEHSKENKNIEEKLYKNNKKLVTPKSTAKRNRNQIFYSKSEGGSNSKIKNKKKEEKKEKEEKEEILLGEDYTDNFDYRTYSLIRELEDPGNNLVKDEIQRLLIVNNEVGRFNQEFEELTKNKTEDQSLLESVKSKEAGTYLYYINNFNFQNN